MALDRHSDNPTCKGLQGRGRLQLQGSSGQADVYLEFTRLNHAYREEEEFILMEEEEFI